VVVDTDSAIPKIAVTSCRRFSLMDSSPDSGRPNHQPIPHIRILRRHTLTVMPLTGEYEPSALEWVRDQVATYEATDGREANTLRETGIPVIIVTSRGAATGKIRKFALMRVEHDGEYALVASMGGAPRNPGWYHNLVAEPLVMIQDGPEPHDYVTHIADGDERASWWERAVEVFPTYSEYEARTDRVIPIFVAGRVD